MCGVFISINIISSCWIYLFIIMYSSSLSFMTVFVLTFLSVMNGAMQAFFCFQVYGISGEGNGTPLQYSCLENPMDRGAW